VFAILLLKILEVVIIQCSRKSFIIQYGHKLFNFRTVFVLVVENSANIYNFPYILIFNQYYANLNAFKSSSFTKASIGSKFVYINLFAS